MSRSIQFYCPDHRAIKVKHRWVARVSAGGKSIQPLHKLNRQTEIIVIIRHLSGSEEVREEREMENAGEYQGGGGGPGLTTLRDTSTLRQ